MHSHTNNCVVLMIFYIFFRLWLHMYNQPNAVFNIFMRNMESGPLYPQKQTSSSFVDGWVKVEQAVNSGLDFQVKFP